MAIKVGINGFGRIGRQVVRAAKEDGMTDLDFVAVNDLTDTKTLAHLFKYDSVHRTYRGTVSHGGDGISIDGDLLKVFAERKRPMPARTRVQALVPEGARVLANACGTAGNNRCFTRQSHDVEFLGAGVGHDSWYWQL